MEEFIFQSFDDSLFESTKSLLGEKSKYSALKCEPEWFVKSEVADGELIKYKYRADHYYLIGKYQDSFVNYRKYIENSPQISLITKRECLEGMVRSIMKSEIILSSSEKFAEELYSLSSTFDSYTVSLSLLVDLYLKQKNYTKAIRFGQNLANHHFSNSDIWIKLAYCYSCFWKTKLLHIRSSYNDSSALCLEEKHDMDIMHASVISLYDMGKSVPGTVLTSQNFVTRCKEDILTITALLYAKFHLDSVVGSTCGFAHVNNILRQECILLDLNDFGDVFNIDEIKAHIKSKFCKEKKEIQTDEAFVDRGSSNFIVSLSNFIYKDIGCEEFITKWVTYNSLQCMVP